jgi:hypothetical protein
MLVQNGGCEPDELRLDPEGFRALYALNRIEFDDAAEGLDSAQQQQLKRLLKIPDKERYDWTSAKDAWDKCISNVLFVLAHSDARKRPR